MSPMHISSDLKRNASRLVKAGSLLAIGALSLGTVDAQPVAAHAFVAKAQSLNPVPLAVSAPQPVVQQEIVTEEGETVATAPVAKPTRKRGGGACGLDTIKQRESGGNYGATSKSGKYRGAYQFDQRTWESTGGSGDPAAASPQEQDSRAAALYARRGSQPWSVCH